MVQETGPTTALPEVASRIRTKRGIRVVLDEDLAALYGVTTKRLNEAVSRNLARFPSDFMFRLTAEEGNNLRSQIATSRPGHGGRRYSARAFTEHGVAMLSGVLRSPAAINVNIDIMRAFVMLRRLERDHAVFDAIRDLQTPPASPTRRPIGFPPARRRI